jgi:membrane protein DedA with SNARE-associated domain
MQTSVARLLTAILIAAAGITLGVKLAIYAEADDAPGGVVIGGILVLGSLVAGTAIALRRSRNSSSTGG